MGSKDDIVQSHLPHRTHSSRTQHWSPNKPPPMNCSPSGLRPRSFRRLRPSNQQLTKKHLLWRATLKLHRPHRVSSRSQGTRRGSALRNRESTRITHPTRRGTISTTAPNQSYPADVNQGSGRPSSPPPRQGSLNPGDQSLKLIAEHNWVDSRVTALLHRRGKLSHCS